MPADTPPPGPVLPDPALVVLVGPAGSGKSHWAASRYRAAEVVSSDALRAVVGSGEADLDASRDAFAVLDQIVAARLGRRLTTVVDTLGFETARRQQYLAAARSAGLPAAAVVMTTDAAVCRQRNAARDRPVPAPVLRAQFTRQRAALAELDGEGWDVIARVDSSPVGDAARPVPGAVPTGPSPAADGSLRIMLQVSRFPWGQAPLDWLTALASAAEQVGFAGIALMDHLIQIPLVDRAWEPIPEPFVTLGALAGATSSLQLGTLVSPVTFRPPGIVAKAIATLDVLSGGRAFLGLGAGWWEREHLAFGLPFPPPRDRLDQLERHIEIIRALWAPGTKAYRSPHWDLPETTCYPRPVGRVPIIVGGNGERRTLRIAAQFGDGCNLPSAPDVLQRKMRVLHQHCRDVGRDPADIAVTVLDVPVIGTDRDDVARRVERLRGRTAAAAFAARHHAGTIADQLIRYRRLAEMGVDTVFLAVPDLTGQEQIHQLAPLVAALG